MASSPFVGEIMMFGFNFAPRGFALCNGQLLPISQNTALFSLLGTFYGGNGQTTFALPNLQGRVAMGQGQGPGLTPRVLGETSGVSTVILLPTEIPQHTHTLNGLNQDGDKSSPSGNMLAGPGADRDQFLYSGTLTNQVNMNAAAIGITGGGQPHNNMQPYLTINFCIATQGIFPARN